MSKIKITFVIPCFNSANLMERCFDSLTNQTMDDIEFIFVDDGSNDNTKEVIENFRKIEPRARLISQKNQGITAARLTGLNSANSEYVSFLDADDYIDFEVAEEAYNYFASDENIDALLYNFVYLKGGQHNVFKLNFDFPLDGFDVISNTIPSWKIYTNGIYRTIHALEAYNKINFKSTNSDEIANRLIFEKCKKVGLIESSYYYVQYPSSTSKYPSKNYITRLESAYWLRNYSRDNWSHKVSYKSADIHFLNELCSLALKYSRSHKDMPNDVKVEWSEGIFKYRKYAIDILYSNISKLNFSFFLSDKLIRKSGYMVALPLLLKSKRRKS